MTLDEVMLLRSREAAELLGVSLRQLDRLVEAGAIKPIRLTPGGNRRYRLRDLAQLIDAGAKANGEPHIAHIVRW